MIMKLFSIKNLFIYCIISLLFFIGGLYVGKKQYINTNTNNCTTIQTKHEKGYTYINPLLECELVNELGNPKIRNVENIVNKIIDSYDDIDISLYYRDLSNGPWFGINMNTKFAPQSLLKLPVLFAYLKYAESQPNILKKKLLYMGQKLIEHNLEPAERITPGEEYEIEYLLYRMIALSDNTALELLMKYLPVDILKKVHSDLDIPYPNKKTSFDYITVRSYSSLFRVLYNSSYLSRKYSNLALEYLIKSDFKNGLVKSIPSHIKVAHKYGIKTLDNNNATTQLHDCGIIYIPDKPYVLCIMTKGNDLIKLEDTVDLISKTIYTEIIKNN